MAQVRSTEEDFHLGMHLTGGDMKTQGEMEAAICEGVSRFEQDYMGRGPKGHLRPPARGSPCGPPFKAC